MPRREIQRSWEAAPSAAFAAGVATPNATGVVPRDASAFLNSAPLAAETENARVCSPSAAPPRAEAPIQARRAHALSLKPPPVTAAPAENEIETESEKRETTTAPRRAPLDGELIRRRWRSLIGRHPPKTLSHALMDRILAWREQVAEGGDISSRSRALLAGALAGKMAGVGKDGQVHDGENNGRHSAHRHQPRAQIRVGTVLVREHAGVLNRVDVVAEGFEWEGRIYASLSAVARAITGVQWNGRRFFALDRSARQVARSAVEYGDAYTRRASRGPNSSSRAGGGP